MINVKILEAVAIILNVYLLSSNCLTQMSNFKKQPLTVSEPYIFAKLEVFRVIIHDKEISSIELHYFSSKETFRQDTNSLNHI